MGVKPPQSHRGPRVSPHLGCQGLPGLDMLNAYNKLEYNVDLVIISDQGKILCFKINDILYLKQ